MSKSIDELQKLLAERQAVLKSNTADRKRINDAYQKLNKDLDALKSKLKKIKEEGKEVDKKFEVAKLNAEIDSIEAEQQKLSGEREKINATTRLLEQIINSTKQEIQKKKSASETETIDGTTLSFTSETKREKKAEKKKPHVKAVIDLEGPEEEDTFHKEEVKEDELSFEYDDDDIYLKRAVKVGKKSQEQRKEAASLLKPEGMKAYFEKIEDTFNRKSKLASETVTREKLDREYKQYIDKATPSRPSVTKATWEDNRRIKMLIFEKVQVVKKDDKNFEIRDNSGTPPKPMVNIKQKLDVIPKTIEFEGFSSPLSDKEIMCGFLEPAREVWKRTGKKRITFSNLEEYPERALRIQQLGDKIGLDVKFNKPTLDAIQKYRSEFKETKEKRSRPGPDDDMSFTSR